MSDDDKDVTIPLTLELITASRSGMDDVEFTRYARTRVLEDLGTLDEAVSVITTLAFFAGSAVQAWAEDTERDPDDVLRAIALDAATDDDDPS